MIRLLWSRLAICTALSFLVMVELIDREYTFAGMGYVFGVIAFVVAALWSSES